MCLPCLRHDPGVPALHPCASKLVSRMVSSTHLDMRASIKIVEPLVLYIYICIYISLSLSLSLPLSVLGIGTRENRLLILRNRSTCWIRKSFLLRFFIHLELARPAMTTGPHGLMGAYMGVFQQKGGTQPIWVPQNKDNICRVYIGVPPFMKTSLYRLGDHRSRWLTLA